MLFTTEMSGTEIVSYSPRPVAKSRKPNAEKKEHPKPKLADQMPTGREYPKREETTLVQHVQKIGANIHGEITAENELDQQTKGQILDMMNNVIVYTSNTVDGKVILSTMMTFNSQRFRINFERIQCEDKKSNFMKICHLTTKVVSSLFPSDWEGNSIQTLIMNWYGFFLILQNVHGKKLTQDMSKFQEDLYMNVGLDRYSMCNTADGYKAFQFAIMTEFYSIIDAMDETKKDLAYIALDEVMSYVIMRVERIEESTLYLYRLCYFTAYFGEKIASVEYKTIYSTNYCCNDAGTISGYIESGNYSKIAISSETANPTFPSLKSTLTECFDMEVESNRENPRVINLVKFVDAVFSKKLYRVEKYIKKIEGREREREAKMLENGDRKTAK